MLKVVKAGQKLQSSLLATRRSFGPDNGALYTCFGFCCFDYSAESACKRTEVSEERVFNVI